MKFIAAAFVLWMGTMGQTSRADSPPSLVATSSGEHVWIAVQKGQEWRILHHTRDMGGEYCREATVLSGRPAVLAARQNRLWILEQGAGAAPQSVFSLATHRNPATGSFYYTPPGRLDVLPSPPGSALVSSFASGFEGPVAVASSPGTKGELLLGLGVMEWSELLLPEGISSPPTVTWSATTSLGWALCSSQGDALLRWIPSRTQVGAEAAPAEIAWQRLLIEHGGSGFEMVVPGCSTDAIVRVNAENRHEVDYISQSGLRKLCDLPEQADPWSLVGIGDGFALISTDGTGTIHVTHIDGTTGSATTKQSLVDAPSDTSDWIHLPLLGAMTIGLLLAGFILRPPIEPVQPMPQGWQPLPMGRRVIALGIDMIPGVVVALFVFDGSLVDLLAMPSWTPDLTRAWMASVVMGITTLWCFGFEVALRATPGKFIVGGRIIASSVKPGSKDFRAGAGASALRALIKGAVLFAPALGFLAFVHPLQQGLPETLTKTVVARPIG